MKTYLAYIVTTLKLTMRDRVVLFFNYLLPLLFFIVFAQSFGADKGGALSQVITMVLIMGVLGSGFFGAGLRAVQERELNILRRFKVAPITPLPILVSSLVTGVVSYLPSLGLILLIARFYYGMPLPQRWLSLTLMLCLGLVSFRSIGLVIASVANSMQESQIIIQLLYLPMLFLSGATFPISILPTWLQIIAQFLPASYLYTGLNGILVQKESLVENAIPVAGMLVTTAVAVLLGVKLFRWEKDEKLPASAKLWLVAVLLPFLLLGVFQSYSRQNVAKAKILYREMRRNRALMIRGPRIVFGDGTIKQIGAVLLRDGRIEQILDAPPSGQDVGAEIVEAAGKTLMPGLLDAQVRFTTQGGVSDPSKAPPPDSLVKRASSAYLYSGVVAVQSAGDAPSMLLKPQALIASGEELGAELRIGSKTFTTPGGPGTELLRRIPDGARQLAERETFHLPANVAEARAQVAEARRTGANAIRVVLESSEPAKGLSEEVLQAIVAEAKKFELPVTVRTGDPRDLAAAIAAGAGIIELGSARQPIPAELLAQMASRGIAYCPSLAWVEASGDLAAGNLEPLDRTLALQVAPDGLIEATRKALQKAGALPPGSASADLSIASQNLLAAWKAGVTLVTGTGSGSLLLIHGPAVHRELQLWVKAGVAPADALKAATSGTASALGLGRRVGQIRIGYDASLLLLDGNPLDDISATERISAVYFHGERVDRAGLFERD